MINAKRGRYNPFTFILKRLVKRLVQFIFIFMSYFLLTSNAYSDTYNFATQWGTYGSGNSQFYWPMGIAADTAGSIYVVDGLNNRIEKFDSLGNYIMQWGGLGDYTASGAFSSPNGIAVDSSGNVYVTDYGNARVEKFDSNGVYITQWGVANNTNPPGNGQLSNPTGIAVDGAGYVYVSDTSNNRIQKFDPIGNYVLQWGSYGSAAGQFYYPYGIQVDAYGHVYVADSNNHRIQKYDTNGNYITQWGVYGLSKGQSYFPVNLALDSAGNVYVTEVGYTESSDGQTFILSAIIQKFDSNGNYITQWGSFGSANGQFNEIGGIAVDRLGYAYVTDIGNNRVQKFAPVPIPPAMAVPTGQNVYSYTSVQIPATGTTPQSAKPLAIGNLASGGSAFSLYASLPPLASSSDIYIAYTLNGQTYYIMPDLSVSQVPGAWMSATTGPVDASLFPNVAVSSLAKGTYTLYLGITPAGSFFSSYYIWTTQFTVN